MSKVQPNYFIIGIEKLAILLKDVFLEVFHGIRKNTINWELCAGWFVVVQVFAFFNLDTVLWNWLGLGGLYFKSRFFFYLWYIPVSFLGFFVWSMKQIYSKKKLIKVLSDTFINAKLKTITGRLPNFISDFPIDEHSRKLSITSEGIPFKAFQTQKEFIEASLKVYIDDLKENRERGTVEIYYSYVSMPTQVNHSEITPGQNYDYVVGVTRSQKITENFKSSPHLLIAGQTGGGKSTLLRQIITNLYLNHKNINFELIDLKEGLEFQIFDNLPRIRVVESMSKVVTKLLNLDNELNRRMALLKENNCKDIDAYQKLEVKKEEKAPINLDRQFIVIDEAAEIFLATAQGKTEEIQKVRKVISRISRLGRACGMHLIIATQRPDVKALDPQVKANLTSIVCFQMPNLPSSMTVLGNGRASMLPPVPGRAIWRSGSHMVEVQTPFLSETDAIKLLEPFKVRESEPVIVSDPRVTEKKLDSEGTL